MLKLNPITIWLTGLPSSGKTTLGNLLELKLRDNIIAVVMLDGDVVRKSICSDLGFSELDRSENIRRIASIAKLLNDQGFVVICCFVSPLATMRSMAREIVGENRFFEVFIDANIATCSKRDVKGLYSKASKGIINDLTGISAPYDRPVCPSIHIQTDVLNVNQSIDLLFANAIKWVNP